MPSVENRLALPAFPGLDASRTANRPSRKMPRSKRTILAAVSAVLFVTLARVLLELGGDFGTACGIVVLFPGMVINLFTRGVHGNWDTPLGEAFMVGVPVLGWFLVIRFALGLIAGKETPKPASPPVKT